MKKHFLWLPAALLLAACSGNSADEQPDFPSTEIFGNLKLNIVNTDFTRAEDGEDAVSSLHIAYYNDDKFIGLVEAETGDNDKFTADVAGSIGNRPNRIVAFVNLPEDEIVSVKKNLSEITSTGKLNVGENFIMTNATRYYGPISENDPLPYISISEEDYTGEGNTIDITVERLAAKVTANTGSTPINTDGLTVSDYQGSKFLVKNFSLSLIGWGISATEKSTLWLKDFKESYFSSPIPSWVTSGSQNIIHWARSASYSSNLSIPTSNKTTETYTLQYPKFSEITNAFGSSAYYHESTRPASDYNTDNAIASIVIVAQYKDQDGAIEDIIKYGETYYTATAFWELVANNQTVIYDNRGGSPSAENFEKYFPLTPTGNGGEAELTATAGFEKFKNKDGEVFESADEATAAIQSQFSSVELFKGGKCFFVVPIKHLGYADANNDKQTLGAYGLVRNHHYNITINSIKGVGSAIPDEEAISLVSGFRSVEKTYTVGYGLNVAGWTELSQTIDIDK